MKTISQILAGLTLIVTGCSTTPAPIDITRLTSQRELDKHVGHLVTFTGSWQIRKECCISNGHIDIRPEHDVIIRDKSVDKGLGIRFRADQMETVTGFLTKYVVDYTDAPTNRWALVNHAQEPSEGVTYHIQKTRPTQQSAVHRYP